MVPSRQVDLDIIKDLQAELNVVQGYKKQLLARGDRYHGALRRIECVVNECNTFGSRKEGLDRIDGIVSNL